MIISARKITKLTACIAVLLTAFVFCGAKAEAASMTFGCAQISTLPVRDTAPPKLVSGTISTGTAQIFTASDADSNSVMVTFEIKDCHTVMGQNVYVVGNTAQLGNWQADKAFALTIQSSGANVPWKGIVKLPANTPLQYKYILWDGKTVTWEGSQKTASGNREVTTPSSSDVHYNDGSFLVTPAK